jgi:hypothetical protein
MQQMASNFHISGSSKEQTRNGLGGDRALMWTSHTEKAASPSGSPQLLKPNPPDNSTHRKTQ